MIFNPPLKLKLLAVCTNLHYHTAFVPKYVIRYLDYCAYDRIFAPQSVHRLYYI